jgi:hypothetical protein
MTVSSQDRDILRRLAAEVAEIAALDVQAEKIDLWKRLNRLEPVRPLVWINEICWGEMGPEMDLQCTDDWCRGQEFGLRRVLYQWRHLPGDMTVDANLWSALAVRDTGYGLVQNATRPDGVGSVDFVPVLTCDADIEKIQMPTVTHDEEATERNYREMADLYSDIMPVRKRGVCSFWHAPWDTLIRWTGIQEAMIDMIDRPAFIHAAVDRLVAAMEHRLDQQAELNVLSLNNGGVRVGAGGLGWTDELPPPGSDPDHVTPGDCWGNSTPQIFSEVSPEMHWEFSLQYELRLLKRFGLNCYGCCEPLHNKIHILEKIPNLRRISMSPKADKAVAAERMGDRYVFSLKPNPAILATGRWNPDQARADLRSDLAKARGCRIEIIMKDITTVRNEPHRLWEWSRVAMEVAEEFAP